MMATGSHLPMRRARLRIRRRVLPAAAFYRLGRQLITVLLLATLGIGGYRYFTQPQQAGALEFSPHAVSDVGNEGGVLGIASGDMDGDGDIDILSAGNEGVKVYENLGDGEFHNGKVIDPTRGQRVWAVDLDRDGLLDVLATLDSTPGVKWYRNSGGFEFDVRTLSGVGKEAQAFAADINQDNIPDIVTSSNDGGEVFVLRRWMNDGNGGFTPSILPSTGNPKITALTIGDLDKNRYADIVTSGAAGLQVFDTDDGITWDRFDLDDAEKNATHLAVGDVSNDGINDLVVATQGTNKLYMYKFIENFQFQKVTLNPSIDATTIEIRDLDEDGDEDIIVAAQDDDSVFWYDNNGGGEFSQRTIASDISTVFGVSVADFDQDGDFDFATGDHTRGTVWWYERTRAKPVATAPTNIRQTVDGAGRITFDTTVSDGDFDATKIRIQYSLDGDHWYKPWLIRATPETGSVDLKNSNGYQVGTSDAIDTNTENSVKVTLIWDTKSTGNTGGPIVGDVGNVQLRVIPSDTKSIGAAAISNKFRVDNAAPTGLGQLRATSVGSEEAIFSWSKPSDSSAYSYKLYYGTNHTKVLDQTSDVWDGEDDGSMDDIETTSTTVTGLSPSTTYTFKLSVVDEFGNQTAIPSVKVATLAEGQTAPTPAPVTTTTPTPTLAPGATPTAVASPTPTLPPGVTPIPTPIVPTATPRPTPIPEPTLPSTIFENQPPVADAGIHQVVNPSALVILDGTASFDPDNDPLSFSWRQLSGPAVELLSERTATPSLSAGGENETYIFALTVRDQVGASATDTVTIAVKPLPPSETRDSEIDPTEPGEGIITIQEPSVIRYVLRPLDILLFCLALLLTGISLGERLVHTVGRRRAEGASGGLVQRQTSKGKVVHFRTNEPIAGALVLLYSADGKLISQERTNNKGEFPTLFAPGQYSIRVQAENFAFAPAASPTIRPEQGILYSGGKITVPAGGGPVNIVIPMKPIGGEVSSSRQQLLRAWQTTQRVSRLLSWPIFIAGSLLNTVLIFWVPGGLFLTLEILYVFLVVLKVAMEVRIRPAYGLVRDSITHVPIDLAVVRLFEQGTNRLIMTRVTDAQGKFFALPPSGTYTVTITKPGYAVFSKSNVSITSEQDSVLQMTADLMAVAPGVGLAGARAAVL